MIDNPVNPHDKIEELGIKIPDVASPAAAYVPFVVSDNTVYVSGQLPFEDGKLSHKGLLGKNVSVEEAQIAARNCAINLIACIKEACSGNLAKLDKVLHLQVLVASTPDFNEQHLVANGASDLFVEVFGDERGSHTRAAFGTASLPLGAAVEIAGTFKIAK